MYSNGPNGLIFVGAAAAVDDHDDDENQCSENQEYSLASISPPWLSMLIYRSHGA
jgi:hypothetical protein